MGYQRGCGGQPGSRPPELCCCVLPQAGALSLSRGQGPGSVMGISNDPTPQALSPMSPQNRASPRRDMVCQSPRPLPRCETIPSPAAQAVSMGQRLLLSFSYEDTGLGGE